MPIYTKTGDKGETSLFGGKRVLKCNELVEAYGSLDELNSWVGLVASQITDQDTVNFLQDIQSDLFTIGSVMAGWPSSAKASAGKDGNPLGSLKKCAEDMEVWIDTMENQLAELRNFVLPGGTTVAAWTQLTRAVCRRVERQIVALHKRELQEAHLTPDKYEQIIKYINRLSDLLFMLARYINKDAGVGDVKWSGIEGSNH